MWLVLASAKCSVSAVSLNLANIFIYSSTLWEERFWPWYLSVLIPNLKGVRGPVAISKGVFSLLVTVINAALDIVGYGTLAVWVGSVCGLVVIFKLTLTPKCSALLSNIIFSSRYWSLCEATVVVGFPPSSVVLPLRKSLSSSFSIIYAIKRLYHTKPHKREIYPINNKDIFIVYTRKEPISLWNLVSTLTQWHLASI